jgi:nucleoside-diphosphate-sugar epimerase
MIERSRPEQTDRYAKNKDMGVGMRVLITGANGFIGHRLCEYLYNVGLIVEALDLDARPAAFISRFYTWDEFDTIPFMEMEAIIHLAGLAHDLRKASDESAYYEINFGLTRRIVDRLANHPPVAGRTEGPVFILMSSVKACADAVVGTLTEEAEPSPVTPYGKSKLMAEDYVAKHYRPYYILRSCMVHGPGNKGNLNLLFKFSRLRFPWPLGAYESARSFLSIDNLCFVFERIILAKAKFGIYIVADDEPISTSDILRIFWKAQGRRGIVLRIPKTIVRFCAWAGEVLHLPLNTENLAKLTEPYVASNGKLKKALGIDRLPLDPVDGLSRAARYFADQA